MITFGFKKKEIFKSKSFAFFFIISLSFFLRLYHLGYHELWYDEILTIKHIQNLPEKFNPPAYWILLYFWVKLFGISKVSLRLPSLLFSFFSVVLTFFLGKSLFNKKVGIIASLFIGLSAFHIWYAQEARHYSMSLFFGTASSYLLFKAIKERKSKLWLFFILVSIIGIYTSYFYIFLFIAQGLSFIFLRNLRLGFKEVISFLIIALGFSLYLPKFLSRFYFVWQGFWINKPTWRSLVITPENFILGYNGFPFLYFISNILTGLFFISSLRALRRKTLRQSFIFSLFLFFIPITCIFYFSKVFFSVYLDRGLIIFSPYYYIVLSLGLVSLNKMIRPILLVILIGILLIANYSYFKDWMGMPLIHHVGVHIKKPIKPIVKFLEDNMEPQDIIAFTSRSILCPFYFYSTKKYFFYYFFDPACPSDFLQRPLVESYPSDFSQTALVDSGFVIPLQKVNSLQAKRIWVISSDWARSGKLDGNSQSVKNWLDKQLKLEFSKELEGVWIFRYIK